MCKKSVENHILAHAVIVVEEMKWCSVKDFVLPEKKRILNSFIFENKIEKKYFRFLDVFT